MEKIPAASAMEWSIELEKGLRSKNPDCRVKAVEQIGHRLQQWSDEAGITRAISDMYGMVPGEERLFANTILLRLADAFRYGDNNMRRCILKAFMLESKRLRKREQRYDGIMAKWRVPNYEELLKRVKVVFDTGDVEARALALSLFGCWAHLAKDSTQMRYMILLSLQSSHVLEVKASLFAAGCFCRLSEDFSCIVLEILIDIISSPQGFSSVKVAASRAVSTIRCSLSVAIKAYKAGKKLLLTLQQDEVKCEMLLSLSKLAFGSPLLVPEQVDLLLSFLTQESDSPFKARALRCLYFLVRGGSGFVHANRNVVDTMFHIIDDSDLPPKFHCEALQILCKIFSSTLPDLLFMDMPGFLKLVLIAKSAAQSTVKEKRSLALGLLVDMVCSVNRAMQVHWCCTPEKWHAEFLQCQESSLDFDLTSDRDVPKVLVCHVASLIFNCLDSLIKQMFVASSEEPKFMDNLISCGALPEVKQEFNSLLKLILILLEEYPSSVLIALHKIKYLIQKLVSMLGSFNMETGGTFLEVSQMELCTGKRNPVLGRPGYGNNKNIFTISELILCMCRFTKACLCMIHETDAGNDEVYQIVKGIVKCVELSGSFNCGTYEIFCLRMCSFDKCKYFEVSNHDRQDMGNSKVGAELRFTHDICWVSREWWTLELIKEMLKGRKYWEAYRAGKYSCCEGAWFAAAFTFRKLMDGVQSDLCRCWIRSLMFLAGGESEIKALLFPKVGLRMINVMRTENNCGNPFSCDKGEMSQYDEDSDLCDCKEKLARVNSRICSSEKILASTGASNDVYYFQRWFLSLRTKVLQILVDMHGLLESHALTEDTLNKGLSVDADFTSFLRNIPSLAPGFARISVRLNILAKEYDLLAVSFMDIDSRSFASISRLALSCSTLAFCTAFTLCSNSLSLKNGIPCSLSIIEESPLSQIVRDLVERLWDVDSNITADLQQFMAVLGEVPNNLQARTQLHSPSHIDRAYLSVCRYAISGIIRIQDNLREVKNEEGLHAHSVQGLQLLYVIIRKWMKIPFMIPKYFFRVRKCIGAELFVFNPDTKNTEGLSISPGSQLSLNLCIQLKNPSSDPCCQVAKVYCILAVMPADHLPISIVGNEKQANWSLHDWEIGGIVELNEILLQYVRTDYNKANIKQSKGDGGSDLVTTLVCFEPNDKGQGFSTCMIDVSTLSEGSYPVKWHSCCIDKKGYHWNLVSLNTISVLTVKKTMTVI